METLRMTLVIQCDECTASIKETSREMYRYNLKENTKYMRSALYSKAECKGWILRGTDRVHEEGSPMNAKYLCPKCARV